MGKLISEERPTTMATKIAPTSEQLRLAALCMDKTEDQAATKERCQEIMKLTGCAEATALVALHECDNVFEVALNKILDGGPKEGEWQTTGKKAKKSNQARGDVDQQNHGSSHQHHHLHHHHHTNSDCNGDFNINLSNVRAGAGQNDDDFDQSAILGDQGQHQQMHQSTGSRFHNNDNNNNNNNNYNSDGFRRGGPRRNPGGGFGGGFGGGSTAANNNRDGADAPSSRPFRGRGRGFGPRGGRARGRGGFYSNDYNGGDAGGENSTDRESRTRGAGRRGGGFYNDQRGGARGSRGGGFSNKRHNENADFGFQNGMNTWTNETESNTWDNSMAGKWNNNQANEGAMIVDEWKSTSVVKDSNSNNTTNNNNNNNNNNSSNTWDNSMAQDVNLQQQQQAPQPRRSKEGGHGQGQGQDHPHQQHQHYQRRGSGANYNTNNANTNNSTNSRQQHHYQQHHPNNTSTTTNNSNANTGTNYNNNNGSNDNSHPKCKPVPGAAAVDSMDNSHALKTEDWNHDDWTGEEVDWQNMNRVYVNMAAAQQQQQQQQSLSTKIASALPPQQHQQQPPLPSQTGPIPASNNATTNTAAQAGALSQQQQQKAAAASRLTASPSASAVTFVPSAGSMQQQQHQHPQHDKQGAASAVDSAGVRGASIDVNMLFGQKSTSNEGINDSLSGSWNKQATDAIKNELGIGKSTVSNVERMPRNTRQFVAPKPTTSKVEMPSSVPNVGKIDVEFGEFNSSLNLRTGAGNVALDDQQQSQQQSNYYVEFGSTASYNPAEMDQKSLNEANNSNKLNSASVQASSVAPSQQQSASSSSSIYQQQRATSKDQQQQGVRSELSCSAPSSNAVAAAKDGSMVLQKTNSVHQQQAQQGNGPVELLYGAGSVSSTYMGGVRPPTNDSNVSSGIVAVSGEQQPYQQQQQLVQSQQQQLQVQQQQTQQQQSVVNSNRSPSMMSASGQTQTKSQPSLGLTTQHVQNQQQQQSQRSFVSNNSQSSTDQANNISQISKESVINPSMITLPSTQGVSGLGYNNNNISNVSASRTNVTSATGKQPQMNAAAVFNPANAYNQALAAIPYMYPAADQNYLNALQFLSPAAAAAAGYPFSALPFDLTSLSLRDTQTVNAGSSDAKQYMGQRSDAAISGANTSINAPPGLGPATVQNAEQQAAQLLTPAAAAAFTHPYQLMQPPQFYPPFVVPTVTNSTASTVNTNQYNKNFASVQPMFYGAGDMQIAQEYSKSMYGMNMNVAAAAQQQQTTNQNKQQQGSGGGNASGMNINASDISSKNYQANALKMFDGKTFQQSTATPPPGMSNMGYPPGAAFHSSNPNAAAAAAAAAAYGPYTAQFLPHQIGMLPPNMAAAAAAQAQTVNPSDVLAGAGGQRGANSGNKAGPNMYTTAKNNAYWPN